MLTQGTRDDGGDLFALQAVGDRGVHVALKAGAGGDAARVGLAFGLDLPLARHGPHCSGAVESGMSDDRRTEILGKIQALRADVERVGSREEARALKLRILALAVNPPPDVKQLVAEFLDEARATITRTLGTSAWLDPETREEAIARMGTLPSASGDPGQLLSDQELAAAEATIRAAIRWADTGPKSKVMPMFDLIMAELRRLRGAR